jgi:hypothetical protein
VSLCAFFVRLHAKMHLEGSLPNPVSPAGPSSRQVQLFPGGRLAQGWLTCPSVPWQHAPPTAAAAALWLGLAAGKSRGGSLLSHGSSVYHPVVDVSTFPALPEGMHVHALEAITICRARRCASAVQTGGYQPAVCQSAQPALQVEALRPCAGCPACRHSRVLDVDVCGIWRSWPESSRTAAHLLRARCSGGTLPENMCALETELLGCELAVSWLPASSAG